MVDLKKTPWWKNSKKNCLVSNGANKILYCIHNFLWVFYFRGLILPIYLSIYIVRDCHYFKFCNFLRFGNYFVKTNKSEKECIFVVKTSKILLIRDICFDHMTQIKIWPRAYFNAWLKTVDPQYWVYGLLIDAIGLFIFAVILMIPYTIFGCCIILWCPTSGVPSGLAKY